MNLQNSIQKPQGRRSVFLGELAGNKWQASIGFKGGQGRKAGGSRVEPLKIFTGTPLNCKKTSFLTFEVHLVFDKIGMKSYTSKKVEGCSPQLPQLRRAWAVSFKKTFVCPFYGLDPCL